MSFLRGCGLIETEHLLVVRDPCDNVGSAGSALNALLITVEHLCAQHGLSVLNESLLESSKIFIILLGETKGVLPLGAAFLHSLNVIESPWIVPDWPIARVIRNVNELAKNTNRGVWISGTDALWKMTAYLDFAPESDQIAAFYFEGNADHSLTHGTYELDEKALVTSLRYRSGSREDQQNVALALLYLPPALSTRFLSLHSVYPISRSTYYGADSGLLGLRLSLFFDLVLATCLSENEFVCNQLITEKSDANFDVLKQSRQEIWKRFHLQSCRAYCLQLDDYDYLGELQFSDGQLTLEQVIENLKHFLLLRISSMVLDGCRDYSLALLLALMAINKNYDLSMDILGELETLCVRSAPHCARALMLTSEYLALDADGRGGIRSGPAANPTFTRVFDLIGMEPQSETALRELYKIVRMDWLGTETEMIRAARHFEAAAQIYTRIEVERICRKHFCAIPDGNRGTVPENVIVEAAARVDLFGGWLDTPPITLHASPSAVVNMAILLDEKKPVACHIRRRSASGVTVKVGDLSISFPSSESIFESCNKPTNPGALICACLICLGIPENRADNLVEVLQARFFCTSLEIECFSTLPHGSGLGTSSILAATVIQGLGRASGYHYSEKSVCHAVLMVEQLLTTGGGWQDQVGCLYPGIKKGYVSAVDGSVSVERLNVTREFEEIINRRLVLVYTGKTRLAKNLLQEVVRGWYSGGPIRDVIASLENNVCRFASSMEKGVMPIDLIELYYSAKKKLASGCEPEFLSSLISRLKAEELIETAWLAGAGGGGFLYVWLKDGITVEQIRLFVSHYGTPEMSVHTATIDNSPLVVILK